jgi:hypothetical protein
MYVFAAAPDTLARSPQAAGPDVADAVLYRVFLTDGTAMVSYGEFARVADHVVVSVPIGGTEEKPLIHLLTIAESEVDWERTNAYAQAARAKRYADTQGPADFSALSWAVADILAQVGQVEDAAKRLALAESARRQLVEWPAQHHGYRADEITQMTTWLDQVVSELRIAAGQARFDLALVAAPSLATPAAQLLPSPSLRERVEFGMIAARRATDSTERVSLLRAVLEALQPHAGDGAWTAAMHARASAELAVELKADRAYAELTNRALASAEPYVRRADVRGLESLVRAVLDQDRKLQRARPAEIAALLATLDARIDAARRLRLARDAWALRSAVVREYWGNVRTGVDRMLGLRSWLADVRQLAGPAPKSVRRLAEVAGVAGRELGSVQPPAEAATVHARLIAASGLAARAAAARLDALRTANMETAWQASSAAAGALMLLDEAVQEVQRIIVAPRPEIPRQTPGFSGTGQP